MKLTVKAGVWSLGLLAAGEASAQSVLQYVNPNIGTAHSRWFFYTPAAVPYGMAKLAPSTNGHYGNPSGWEAVANIVVGYGYLFQCSLMRDSSGQALPLSEEALQTYMRIRALKGRLPRILNDNFQLPLARGENKNWKCRAGARHFEVDGAGLVHLCQPKTGSPAKPLADYSVEDIRRQFQCGKTCAARCPIAYAHLGSRLDGFRGQHSA